MPAFNTPSLPRVFAIGFVLVASAALAWTAITDRSAPITATDSTPLDQSRVERDLSLADSVAWTLEVLNSGTTTQAEIGQRIAPEALRELPAYTLISIAGQLAQLGPFTQVGYTRPPTAHQATVLLNGANGLQFVLPIAIESSAPHRISDLTFMAMPAASPMELPVMGASSQMERFDGLVRIEGRDVYLSCSGSGSPTVILESGLGDSAAGWFATQTAVSEFTRVCSYDRPNTTASASDRADTPRTGEDVSRELAELLAAAGESGPYVLVGHSIGGQFVRIFAAQHPDEVVGLVLIDATHEQADADRVRFATPAAFANLQEMLQANSEGIVLEQTAMQVQRARSDLPLGSLPLVVVAAGLSDPANFVAGWPMEEETRSHDRLQADLATLSSRGELVIGKASTHYIHLIDPGLVLDAIRSVVTTGRPPVQTP